MAKDKKKDGHEFTITLSGFSRLSIERAVAAIMEELGDLPTEDGYKSTLKFKGGDQLAERMVAIKARLRERRGVDVEIADKHVQLIEPDLNATFWDPEQQEAVDRARRLREREAGGATLTFDGVAGAAERLRAAAGLDTASEQDADAGLDDDPADDRFRKLLGDLDADDLTGEEE